MDELVKLVVKKTGISEEMARTAVETVLGFLKDKLPPQIAGQLDGLIEGGPGLDLGDLTSGLGGLLGNR
jgi:hypothetical protein